jgi:hypothetical protein
MKYQLIVKIPFEAIDDIEARKEATGMLQGMAASEENAKLQEIYDNKPPRGIALV